MESKLEKIGDWSKILFPTHAILLPVQKTCWTGELQEGEDMTISSFNLCHSVPENMIWDIKKSCWVAAQVKNVCGRAGLSAPVWVAEHWDEEICRQWVIPLPVALILIHAICSLAVLTELSIWMQPWGSAMLLLRSKGLRSGFCSLWFVASLHV